MQIMLGEYELVHSGIVIQIKNTPIKVTLNDEVEGDFSFVFHFTNDEHLGPFLTKYTQDGIFIWNIEFMNFTNASNTGSKNMVPVGTLRHLPLFLNYRITDLKSDCYSLTFNFYVGKEIKHAN